MATAAVEGALDAHFAKHHGIITMDEALGLGLSPGSVQYRLRSGRWRTIHRGVYAPAGVPLSAYGTTLAACIAAGPLARASHRSAGWLWSLLRHPPARPALTLPSSVRRALDGVEVHRSDACPAVPAHAEPDPCHRSAAHRGRPRRGAH
ncbi:MAG: type IV toxin-antitoxin system AbiEi family antitoxin domain-containing protein [Acidimicrobiales bacterium]